MNQHKGFESRVYFPDGYQQDLLLEEWLADEFGDLSNTADPVFVSYDSKETCTVPKNHLLIRNQFLSDGRLLRCDWVSHQRKGGQGSHFVKVEELGGAAIASGQSEAIAPRITARMTADSTNFHTGNFIQVSVATNGFISYTEFLPGNAVITVHYFSDGRGCVLMSERECTDNCFFVMEEFGEFSCLDDLLSSEKVVNIIAGFRFIDWKTPQTLGI